MNAAHQPSLSQQQLTQQEIIARTNTNPLKYINHNGKCGSIGQLCKLIIPNAKPAGTKRA